MNNNLPLTSGSVQRIDIGWGSLRKTEGEVIDKHLMPYK